MSTEQTYWNGLPTPARKVVGTVDSWDPDRDPPMAWWRAIQGQRIEAVEVRHAGLFYGGITYLDNRDGEGWAKVTEGRGGPSWPHKNVPLIDVEVTPDV